MLSTRFGIAANLCENLRQGWEPKERFRIEFDIIQNRIQVSEDLGERPYWPDLQAKICLLLPGLSKKMRPSYFHPASCIPIVEKTRN